MGLRQEHESVAVMFQVQVQVQVVLVEDHIDVMWRGIAAELNCVLFAYALRTLLPLEARYTCSFRTCIYLTV